MTLLDFTIIHDTPRGAFRLYVNRPAKEATLRGPRSTETVRFADVDTPDKAGRWIERNAARLAANCAA